MASKRTLSTFEKSYSKSPEGQERITQLRKQLAHFSAAAPAFIIPTDNEITFGVVSCSHLGSLYANLSGLVEFYKTAKREGAEFILHCGDVCDGAKMYKGQEYEQSAIGWEAQAKCFEDNAPGDLPTHFITGNHDESLKKLAGMDPGSDLARRRPDWKLIGSCTGRVVLDAGNGKSCIVDLMHPGGGSSYAVSYRPQKIVEQLEGGTKPNMLFIGHFHKAEWMPAYRNVCVAQSGCLQWQTPYMRDKGLAAHVGGWIVKVRMGDNCNMFAGSFVAFYR
ncbi:MAG: metallophosphoesterase family protein [Gammaproteobacteria bacterium]|nr:metallophosphoesterase family protein [Gammaproteobacteria bacterium]